MVGRIIQIVILCFVVGVILAAFNTDALGLLKWIAANFEDAVKVVSDFLNWGGHYILLGATVVLPIAAIHYLLKYLKNRRQP